MARRILCCGLVGRAKKIKRGKKSSETADNEKGLQTLYVKVEGPKKSSENDEVRSTSFSLSVPFTVPGTSRCKVKVMNHESPVGREVDQDVAYEGGDKHDENLSMRRDNSDFDLQAQAGGANEENDPPFGKVMNLCNTFDSDHLTDQCKREIGNDHAEEGMMETAKSGELSDPGIGKATFWTSPKLVRSCSDLGKRDMLNKMHAVQLPPKKSQSFEELQQFAENLNKVVPGSPLSVRTQCSADKVILKKHSSSQILPSRSRKLWWKLFLWSHRNLHKVEVSAAEKPALKQQGGYSSDTLEPRRVKDLSKVESPNSFITEDQHLIKNSICDNIDNQSLDGFPGVSGFWPQNQWVAFPGESSTMSRVDEWVKGLLMQPQDSDDFLPSSVSGRSPTRGSSHMLCQPTMRDVPEEIAHANSVIQSLNSSSKIAHIVGIGLKVVPHLSTFSSLRSVNLSGNFIVHVTPGSLPKGLHTLDLSKNKISTIDGLKELTGLRVLDLSYNRISRIGRGLSKCTLIKELYLAGNKINDVEGLHRLLKLTVLDLSFNKVTTTKELGQLAANYNSLLALNLLGNPVQSSIGDDQLRKTVCSLLPKLDFLNKQPINAQRARTCLSKEAAHKRELGKEAAIALGNNSSSNHRKAARKLTKAKSHVQYFSSTKAK